MVYDCIEMIKSSLVRAGSTKESDYQPCYFNTKRPILVNQNPITAQTRPKRVIKFPAISKVVAGLAILIIL